MHGGDRHLVAWPSPAQLDRSRPNVGLGHQAGVWASIQRAKVSTHSWGHGPSHGIEPLRTVRGWRRHAPARRRRTRDRRRSSSIDGHGRETAAGCASRIAPPRRRRESTTGSGLVLAGRQRGDSAPREARRRCSSPNAASACARAAGLRSGSSRRPGASPIRCRPEGGAKLGVVGQPGLVGGLQQQRHPPGPLLLGEALADVLGDHAGVAAVLARCSHVGPPNTSPSHFATRWG